MDMDQLAQLKRMLEARLQEVSRDVRRRDSIAVEKAADTIDNTLLAEERDIATQFIDREFSEMRLIKAALRRIRDGTFGYCRGCEEPITLRRLFAVLHAALCITCQGFVDRDARLNAESMDGRRLE